MNWIVIMAGGGGTRLWPLSRRKRPKQFLHLLPGGETLLGATVTRLGSRASLRVPPLVPPLVPIERTLVVTAADQVEEVQRALPQLPPENIVAEPEARNTAPCIGLATVDVLRRDPDAILGVLPSDQYVHDEQRFVYTVQQALAAAATGQVAVIGIRPTAPETGFGYIQAAPRAAGEQGPRRVLRFVEKPDLATAEGYLASGDYLWNAGMFFFRGDRMLAEIDGMLPPLGRILAAIRRDPSRAATLYPTAPKISIDYAVMEKLPPSGDLVVVEGDFGWNDVGSFAALPEVLPKDAAGNVVAGAEAIAIDARDNVLVATAGPDGQGGGRPERLIAAVGVSGLCVVVTDDAVLVLPRDRAQDVRRVVETLETGRRDPYL